MISFGLARRRWKILIGLDLGTACIFSCGYDRRKLSIRLDGLYEGGIIFEHGGQLVSELKEARSTDKVSLDW